MDTSTFLSPVRRGTGGGLPPTVKQRAVGPARARRVSGGTGPRGWQLGKACAVRGGAARSGGPSSRPPRARAGWCGSVNGSGTGPHRRHRRARRTPWPPRGGRAAPRDRGPRLAARPAGRRGTSTGGAHRPPPGTGSGARRPRRGGRGPARPTAPPPAGPRPPGSPAGRGVPGAPLRLGVARPHTSLVRVLGGAEERRRARARTGPARGSLARRGRWQYAAPLAGGRRPTSAFTPDASGVTA